MVGRITTQPHPACPVSLKTSLRKNNINTAQTINLAERFGAGSAQVVLFRL